MAPWHECGAVEHGGVRLPRARFRSHLQRWRASISIVRHVVPGRLRSGGVALCARACPLVKIAPSFLMAPWHECGAVEHGEVRLPSAQFRSHLQRWCARMSIVSRVVPGRLRSGGVALRACACPLVKIAPSFLMAPWLERGAVEHGGVRLPRARFRSYSQRWRVDISTLRLALTVLVRCRGVALRARARPLVKIAPSISFCRVRVEAWGRPV